ncbi:MAG TPA: hypothetical protein VEW07_08465, partial [Solirubrobacterales bacterium]|nr:hypothetical protein [Solirubrobacterales bacterium]
SFAVPPARIGRFLRRCSSAAWRSGSSSCSAEGLDGDGNHLGRFFISLGLSAALGLAVGLARRRATLRTVAAAIAGDVFLPGLVLLFIIWLFVGTGFCLS